MEMGVNDRQFSDWHVPVPASPLRSIGKGSRSPMGKIRTDSVRYNSKSILRNRDDSES